MKGIGPRLLVCTALTATACDGGAHGPDAGTSGGDAGEVRRGWTGYALGAAPPDAECVFDVDGSTFLAFGSFDIAGARGDGQGPCVLPYSMHVRFVVHYQPESARRGLDDTVEIDAASIRLMTLARDDIAFQAASTLLPNPFTSSASGVPVAIEDGSGRGLSAFEAIPLQYAALLEPFESEQILVEVTLRGSTASDVPVALQPFIFPVEICARCLSICTETLAPSGLTPDDVYDDDCRDDAAADSRTCIDPEC